MLHQRGETSELENLHKLAWVDFEEMRVSNEEHPVVCLQEIADDAVQAVVAA